MTNRFGRQQRNLPQGSQKNTFILMGIFISMISIAYQNCGKVNKVSPNAIDQTTEQKPALLELKNSNSITLLKSSTDGFGMYAYEINVDTGEVEKTIYDVPKNDPSNQPEVLCLDEAQRMVLENEIQKSSVCFFKHKEDPNMNCTMEYRYPYALVNQGYQNIKLGENASACVDFYDICTDNRDNFIKVVNDILVDIDSASCE
jgi:hypothetical protein